MGRRKFDKELNSLSTRYDDKYFKVCHMSSIELQNITKEEQENIISDMKIKKDLIGLYFEEGLSLSKQVKLGNYLDDKLIIKTLLSVKSECEEYLVNLNKSLDKFSSKQYANEIATDLTKTLVGYYENEIKCLEEIISNI